MVSCQFNIIFEQRLQLLFLLWSFFLSNIQPRLKIDGYCCTQSLIDVDIQHLYQEPRLPLGKLFKQTLGLVSFDFFCFCPSLKSLNVAMLRGFCLLRLRCKVRPNLRLVCGITPRSAAGYFLCFSSRGRCSRRWIHE